MKQLLSYLFFMLTAVLAQAQSVEQREARAQKYIRDAQMFYGKANYEAAIREYQFAAAQYRNTNNLDWYAICYNGAGNCYIDLTRYNEAKQEFQRVLALYREARLRDSSFKADSTHIADALEGMGRYYMHVNVNYDSAMSYHQRALRLRWIAYGAQHPKVALSYYFIGKCYRGLGLDSLKLRPDQDFDLLSKEREYLEKALNIQITQIKDSSWLYQLSDTYQAIGDYYYVVRKDYQKGYDYHQKALGLRLVLFGSGHPKTASTYLDLATYYRVVGLFDKELEYLEQALNVQLSVLGENHQDIARNYYLLGNRYRLSGDFEKAVTYYKRSLNIYQTLKTGISAEVADVYHAMGLSYRGLEDRDEDYKNIFKALEMRQQIFGRLHFQVGDSYMELGNYFGERELVDSMLYYYELAAKIWTQQLGENHYRVAQAYDNLAKAHQRKGDTEKALYYLNEALSKKQRGGQTAQAVQTNAGETLLEGDYANSQNKDALELGYLLFDSYLNLAKHHQQQGDYAKALGFAQYALASVCKSLAKYRDDLYQNPSIDDLSHNIDWMEALQLKGELMLQQYQKNKAHKDLEFSLRTYEQALSLVDTLRLNFTSDASKQQLTKRCIPIFEGTIEVLYTLYQQNAQFAYVNKAFEVMERSKAFVLLQALQNLDLKKSKDIPQELVLQEERLRRNLAYYSNYRNRNRKNEVEFDQAYLNAKRQYDSLIRQLEQNYPKYYLLKHQSKVADIPTVQQELLSSGGNGLVEYFVGDRYIYVFVLSKNTQHVVQLPLPKDLSTILASLYTNLTDYQLVLKNPSAAYANFVQSSWKFYETFVQKPLNQLPKGLLRLTIIPDGALGYIPFEVLLTEQVAPSPQKPYIELPMLIQQYELNYSYSATLLLRKIKERRTKNNGLCLGFAPSYAENNQLEKHEELPWAQKELESVQQIFNGEYLFGTDATKERFLEKAADYGILHLATHGMVDLKNSSKSRLAFAQSKLSSAREAAALYAFEIHNLSLNADLVVLSACETGFGRIVRGEGVLSMARAFLYAGSPSVVTTLWKVNDYTSATIMTYFYENLSKGMSKPAALKKAKMDYLRQADATAGHPAFWASYISIGNPEPVSSGWRWWHWAILLGGLGLAGFALWYKVYRPHRAKNKIVEQTVFNPDDPDQEAQFMGMGKDQDS